MGEVGDGSRLRGSNGPKINEPLADIFLQLVMTLKKMKKKRPSHNTLLSPNKLSMSGHASSRVSFARGFGRGYSVQSTLWEICLHVL